MSNRYTSLFNSPLFLGFDQFENLFDNLSKNAQESYPPYNIEKVSEENLRISLAVAGFRQEDLNVAVEDNQLIIRGRQNDDAGRTYLHRGIATRQFQRNFVMAEGIEVTGAEFAHGMLHINLFRQQPKSRLKEVKITSSELPMEVERGRGGELGREFGKEFNKEFEKGLERRQEKSSCQPNYSTNPLKEAQGSAAKCASKL